MQKIFTLLLLMATLTGATQTITHQPDNYNFQYIGRFGKSMAPDFYAFSYPGSEIRFKFTGTELSVSLYQYTSRFTHAYLNLIIDGIHKDSIEAFSGDLLPIFSSSKPETHNVSISLRTEPWMGEILFGGISLNGTLETPDPLPLKKILFSGASWETGYGNMANLDIETSGKTTGTSEMTNNYFSYPAMTAQDLNAQYTCACFGGKGLLRDYLGDTIRQLPELFFSTMAISNEGQYNMAEYVPDVVVFDLGGNDFEVGIPDSAKFVNKYIKLIDTTRKLYPNAHIIISEILLYPQDTVKDSTFIKVNGAYLNAIQNYFTKKGDTKIHHWRYSETGIKVWGQDYHPSAGTYRKVANSLKDFITAKTGIKALGILPEQTTEIWAGIYPNPASGELTIAAGSENGEWKIYNTAGLLIQNGQGKVATVTNLSNGLYMLVTEKGSYNFIKE